MNEIRVLGRNTQGVTLISMEEGTKLVGLERVTENDDGDNASDTAAVEAEVVSKLTRKKPNSKQKTRLSSRKNKMTRIFNFAAGPSAMPLPVLEQAASK